MTDLIGVYGASGCGRGIMPLARAQYPGTEQVFIDDGKAPGHVNGHDILDWSGFLARDAARKSVSLAIADSKIRQTLAKRCRQVGIPLIEVRAASVVEMENVLLGEGACLSPFVTLASNLHIGKCFHANLYFCVEHDSVVGDFVTLARGAKVSGNVTIGDRAYIGSGAVLRPGLTIGARAVVGMGAVVIRDVPPGVTVAGNPASSLIKG